MSLSKDKLLVHLPIDPPAAWLQKVSQRFPGLEVRCERARVVATGLSSADELAPDVLDGVTIMCLYPPPSPGNMSQVRYVQLASAGSDRWVGHPKYADEEVRFCSSSGVHAPQIGEWVIGTWLSHVHSLNRYYTAQLGQSWNPLADFNAFGTDSVGRRMGILGYGAIGRNTARLAKGLGMEVYAYTHSPKPTTESRVDTSGYRVPGTGDPEGTIPARWFSGSVDEFLAQDLDILVVAVPLRETTKGLIGKRQFDILGRGARKTFLSNVARGPIVDTDALVEALTEGTIPGAALDVTDPEPLPSGHPLWTAPNVFISPHVAWQSTNVFTRVLDILFANLERLEKGEPMLNSIKRS